MKLLIILVTLLFSASLLSMGCSTNKQTESSNNTAIDQQKLQQEAEEIKNDEITFDRQVTGVAKLLSLSNHLTEELKENKPEQIKATVVDLDKAWHPLANFFKEKHPVQFDQVDRRISSVTNELSKSTLDKDSLAAQNMELKQALDALSHEIR
ncbi:MAG TPA: hypothetical protein VJ824_03400 [Bacillota bacterium]|nr:hypothetical protein [Bacillota bacterium]